VHPTKSQEKWQIRLEKEIVKEDWHIIYSIPFSDFVGCTLFFLPSSCKKAL
jgi:hypothetical protein